MHAKKPSIWWITAFCSLNSLAWASPRAFESGDRATYQAEHSRLGGSLPKSGPLDFATKSTFPLFFVGEEALVGVY